MNKQTKQYKMIKCMVLCQNCKRGFLLVGLDPNPEPHNLIVTCQWCNAKLLVTID